MINAVGEALKKAAPNTNRLLWIVGDSAAYQSYLHSMPTLLWTKVENSSSPDIIRMCETSAGVPQLYAQSDAGEYVGHLSFLGLNVGPPLKTWIETQVTGQQIKTINYRRISIKKLGDSITGHLSGVVSLSVDTARKRIYIFDQNHLGVSAINYETGSGQFRLDMPTDYRKMFSSTIDSLSFAKYEKDRLAITMLFPAARHEHGDTITVLASLPKIVQVIKGNDTTVTSAAVNPLVQFDANTGKPIRVVEFTIPQGFVSPLIGLEKIESTGDFLVPLAKIRPVVKTKEELRTDDRGLDVYYDSSYTALEVSPDGKVSRGVGRLGDEYRRMRIGYTNAFPILLQLPGRSPYLGLSLDTELRNNVGETIKLLPPAKLQSEKFYRPEGYEWRDNELFSISTSLNIGIWGAEPLDSNRFAIVWRLGKGGQAWQPVIQQYFLDSADKVRLEYTGLLPIKQDAVVKGVLKVRENDWLVLEETGDGIYLEEFAK